MSLREKTLRQLDVCEHRFPAAVIVPKGETFVLARWCIRCGDALFDLYDDQPDMPMEEEL